MGSTASDVISNITFKNGCYGKYQVQTEKRKHLKRFLREIHLSYTQKMEESIKGMP